MLISKTRNLAIIYILIIIFTKKIIFYFLSSSFIFLYPYFPGRFVLFFQDYLASLIEKEREGGEDMVKGEVCTGVIPKVDAKLCLRNLTRVQHT